MITNTLKKLLSTSAMIVVMSSTASASTLPTGGNITAGTGTIAQSGNSMTITQDSAKLAAEWQSFSIGQNNTVNFVQPSADAVALNRVLGGDVSLIQGALNANGKVFLINPNGVTFTPDAQVNVGGLVASTQNISDQDFLDGNYVFEGNSSSTIINQGNIKTVNGGTVALIAAKIINEGTIDAQEGNVLMGSGNKVVLDLGGTVKLEVEEGAIDSLIEQGGAIRADGGYVYLTAKAASELTTSVINHTGITEANTLASGKNGEIYLMGDMEHGVVNVAGKLNAMAPAAGDGGFVETSAASVKVADDARVTTLAANGKSGLWLIDPNDYTVAASGGDITGVALAANLGGGNVQIQSTGAGGNVIVDDAVAWAANKLTLNAHNDILVNANLTATGTGSLAFIYGQDSADGAGSSYTIASGVDVLIPSAASFTWQKGTGGATNNLWFGNSFIKFGGTGPANDAETDNVAAIDGNGSLLQPFYYDDGTSGRAAGWYKLTFDTYPLDFALGTGGDGTNSWNYNGEILATNSGVDISTVINSFSLNIAGYNEGVGALVSTTNVDVTETGSTADIIHNYSLTASDNYIKTTTSVKNNHGTTDLTNVRLWVGTRDDYVGTSDHNYKTKGNLGDGFEAITDTSEQAKAIKISEATDGTGAAVLFYSTSDGADTVTDTCCSFSNVMNKDPRTSQLVQSGDGSYALFLRMNNLTAGASESLTWYYAAGMAANIDDIIQSVNQNANPTPPDYDIPESAAVTSAQKIEVRTVLPIVTTSFAPQPKFSNSIGSLEIVNISSSEAKALAESPAGERAVELSQKTRSSDSQEASAEEGNGEAKRNNGEQDEAETRLTKVLVVNKGVRLPR